uniref:Uncharacterized protein n=1 Tax=Phocoena sinus TaxID=42100 RepID=A0A8C9E661_PHOSS
RHSAPWLGRGGCQAPCPICHGRLNNSLRRSPQSKRKYWQQMVKANVPILLQDRVCYAIRLRIAV